MSVAESEGVRSGCVIGSADGLRGGGTATTIGGTGGTASVGPVVVHDVLEDLVPRRSRLCL